jgi:putative PEP-CTERM system TPR-repeat lipoprotein
MATILFTQNKPEEGLKYLKKAKAANPLYLTSYFNLAKYYAMKREFSKSLDEYKAVLNIDKENINAMVGSAAIYELQGKDSEALSYYKMAKGIGRTVGYINLAEYYLREKQSGKALDVLEDAKKAHPKDLTVLDLTGRIYVSNKEYKKAVNVYEELEKINAEAGLQKIVAVYAASGDFKGALKKLEGALKKQPERMDIMAEMSKMYILMKEPQKAKENANQIIQKKPNAAFGYMVLASVHVSQNDLNSAIESVKKGISVEQNNLAAQMMLGDLYTKKRDFASAMKVYEGLLKSNPGYIPAMFSQAAVYEMTGRQKEAIKNYRAIIEKSENYVPALNNLAYAYVEGSGSKEEALKLAMKAYTSAPNNASVIDTLGYVLLRNGKKDDAKRLLERAVALLPENPSVHYHLALAYKETGDKEKAKGHLAKAIEKKDFPEYEKANKLLQELK